MLISGGLLEKKSSVIEKRIVSICNGASSPIHFKLSDFIKEIEDRNDREGMLSVSAMPTTTNSARLQSELWVVQSTLHVIDDKEKDIHVQVQVFHTNQVL